MGSKKETEISIQDFSKNGWKLIRAYRNEKYNYYAIIECENCGVQKKVNYYNFKNKNVAMKSCKNCFKATIDEVVGNTYGVVKVIEFDHKADLKNKHGHYDLYFKVQCAACKKFSVRKYNTTQWNKTTKCQFCSSTFTEPSYNNLLHVYKSGASNRAIN